MRGTAKGIAPCSPRSWITPADAGNRCTIRRATLDNRDHPRGCGEQSNPHPDCSRREGSPPRMRGTGTGVFRPFDKCGITPADAGNSRSAWMSRGGTKDHPADAGNSYDKTGQPLQIGDHPRGCGEQETQVYICRYATGSPPRMRGTVYDWNKPGYRRRITPADAGNR